MDSQRHKMSENLAFTVTASSPTPLDVPINDFSSFMMFFNDMFVQDEYYSNFNMTADLKMSAVIGQGNQFAVRRLALHAGTTVITSSDHRKRMGKGDNVVLKMPKIREALDNHNTFSGQREIEAIVQEMRVLSHPALRKHDKILDVYGFAWELDKVDERNIVWPVLMVEYAIHGTLQDFLDDTEGLELKQKLELMSDISEGLVALHDCGIAHADLKPDNILVCERPEGGFTAKIADFGYSVIVQEADFSEPWAGGTLGWRPPEWDSVISAEDFFKVDSKRIFRCKLSVLIVLSIHSWTHSLVYSS
jgi:serine/threonine protein kinase